MSCLTHDPSGIRQVSLFPARRLLFAFAFFSRGYFWLGVIKVRMMKAVIGRIVGPSPSKIKRKERATSSVQSMRFTERLHYDSVNNES
ncbi:MAG: hypothetical protein ABJT05_03685, partial [Paracoccaceae bacterium]